MNDKLKCMDKLSLILEQVKAKGKLDIGEFRQLTELGIPVLDGLIKNTAYEDLMVKELTGMLYGK